MASVRNCTERSVRNLTVEGINPRHVGPLMRQDHADHAGKRRILVRPTPLVSNLPTVEASGVSHGSVWDERRSKEGVHMGAARFRLTVALAGGLLAAVATANVAHANDLTIGAAWSLKPAFQEILPMFEKEYGATVKVVYGSSPVLRRQIEQGAPIDVFLPAGVEDVRKLQRKGMTLNGGVRVYALTSLVLVMPSESSAMSLRDLAPSRSTRLALGDPTQSSLGEATAKALTGLDPALGNRAALVHAAHGQAVVDLVRGGRADAGIVYRVDAINSAHVRIVDETPSGAPASVPFGQAVVWTCRESSRATAEDFFNFMISPRIQKLLLKHGFDPVAPNS